MRAQVISREVLLHGIKVFTTWEIVVESVALLRYRLSFEASKVFLAELVPSFTVISLDEAERRAAIDFYLQRSRGRRLSLCDALSYVVVTTRLDWAPCLAFDRDFAALGLTVVRQTIK